jgi:hypothetical protein
VRILRIHECPNKPGFGGGGAEAGQLDEVECLKRRGHTTACLYEPRIEEAAKQFKPDIVHIRTIHNFFGMEPALWALDSGIPVLWHLQDYWPFCGPRMLLWHTDQSCPAVKGLCENTCGQYVGEKYIDIVNRAFVVVGNANTAEIFRRHGVRVDGIVESGIDTTLFHPDYTQRGEQPTVYASNAWGYHPVKGLQVVKRAIKGTGVTVNCVTGVTRERVAEELRKADIFLFPSVYEETFGLSLCEAMASGCAVIASGVAGARAQVHAGMGLLVHPGDDLALRDTIEYLLGNRSLRADLGANARAHVEIDHTLDAMADRWEAVYREVLNG